MKKQLELITACLLLAFTGVTQAKPLVPPNLVKWSQKPDMEQGTDYLSMHRNDGPIVADDFKSDGREISGFHWWGSYFKGAGQGAERNVSFEISIHQDCPTGSDCQNGGPYNYSTPSDGNYFSAVVSAEEDFFGTTDGGEDVYEYWLSVEGLPGPSFWDGTWKEVAGETYWVDFGWNAGQFDTNPDDNVWGWHESPDHNLDFAVMTSSNVSGNPHIGPWDLLEGKDMALEVLTAVPVPAAVWLFGSGLLGLMGIARKKA